MKSELPPSMDSSFPTREEVVELLKEFPLRGITHPDDIRTDEPDGYMVSRAFLHWILRTSSFAEAEGVESDLRFCLSADTLFVDAGFTHPDYLDEVAHDLLEQDMERAKEAGLPDLVEEFRRKIIEVEALIP